MSLPIDLILIRHTQSEGNLAFARSREGDESAYTPEYRARHSFYWRLTDEGIRQAQTVALWLSSHGPRNFDLALTSDFLRARETALYLGLQPWQQEVLLRERSRGQLDIVSYADLQGVHKAEMERQRADPLAWRPPDGENMEDVMLRVHDLLALLRQEAFDKQVTHRSVVLVTHGEWMLAARAVLEQTDPLRFRELAFAGEGDSKEHIHNGQILWYTRRTPPPEGGSHAMECLSDHYTWMRSVCPTDLSRSHNLWRPIRNALHNADLLREHLEKHPRQFNG